MVFLLCGYIVLVSSRKNFDILVQKRPNFAQNMLSWIHIGLAVSFGALLAGWSVVVARGLCLARHLFTLFKSMELLDLLKIKKIRKANKNRHITPKHRISDFLPADSFAVTKLTKWVAACRCHTFGALW